MRVLTGKVFDAKMEPKRYCTLNNLNGAKREPKRSKEPSKTPLRNRVEQVSKKGAKRGGRVRRQLLGPIFVSKPFFSKFTKQKKASPKIINNSVTEEHENCCHKDAKREPEIIDFQLFEERVTLGNCWFYQRNTQHSEG